MASQLRVNKSENRSGLGTITYTDTGAIVSGIVTANSFSGDIIGDITGAVTATTGSFSGDVSIAEKIIHTGDTNTFMKFDTDTITLETAGDERLRITSGGNVGIGTDNPQVKLTVSSTSPAVCDIHHIDGGTNDEARIILGALAGSPPSNRGAGIAAVNNGAGHDLIIKCSASHSAGPGEKVRITSAGKVGIGTDNPGSEIHIVADAPILKVTPTNWQSGLRIDVLGLGNNAANSQLFRVQKDGTTKLQLNEDGDLVITGDDNAELKLKCGTSTGNNIIAFLNSAGTTKGNIFYDSDNNFMVFKTNGTAASNERFRIDSNGKLILGTEYVNGGNADADIKFFLSSSRGSYGGQATNAVIFDNQTAAVDKGGSLTLAGYSGSSAIAKALIRGGNEADAATNAGYFSVFTRPASGGLTEKLRITSDGEVLIGRTNWGSSNLHPNDINKLVVTGTSPADSFDSQCHLEGSETSGAADTGGALAFAGHDGSSYRNWANIYGMKENSTGGNVNSYLSFHTRLHAGSPAEKARINSAGQFLVGRTTPITIASDPGDACFEQLSDNGMALTLHCNKTNKRGLGIYYPSSSGAADAIRFQIGNAAKFLVISNGNCQNANNTYTNISDSRLKENIVDANSQWDDIKNIKIRNYNFKESTGHETHTQIGVIAQEIETVCPKLVDSSGKGGIKAVASSVLYMKAVKALQESMARIETLEAEVAALKSS